jgi:trigger factor
MLAALTLAACSGSSSPAFLSAYDYDDLSQFIKLGEYKGIEYEKTAPVTDEDVKAKIDEDLSQNAEETKIESGTVKEDSVVNIDYVGSIDGVEFEGGTAQGAELDIANSNYIKGFAEGIVGHEVGETFDLNVTFPEDYGKEELNGKDAVFKTTINYMIEKKPAEYTNEWVKEQGYDDKASYEAAVRKELEEEQAANSDSQAKSEVFGTIFDNSEVTEYPEKELGESHERIAKSYETAAKNSGTTLEEYISSMGMDTDSFNKAVDEDAQKSVKTELILRQIAKEEGIEFTESDYNDYLTKMLEDAGYTEEQFKETNGTDIYTYAEENSMYIIYMYDRVMTKVMEYSKAV